MGQISTLMMGGDLDMYRIDKGVPIPPRNAHPIVKSKYPLYQMDIGDSFWVSVLELHLAPVGSKTDYRRAYRRLSSIIRYAADKSGRKFVLRHIGTGFRVWRIK